MKQTNRDMYAMIDKFIDFVPDWDKIQTHDDHVTLANLVTLLKAIDISFWILPEDPRYPHHLLKMKGEYVKYPIPDADPLPDLTYSNEFKRYVPIEKEEDAKAD